VRRDPIPKPPHPGVCAPRTANPRGWAARDGAGKGAGLLAELFQFRRKAFGHPLAGDNLNRAAQADEAKLAELVVLVGGDADRNARELTVWLGLVCFWAGHAGGV
jgi:hypothetical protein